MRMQHRRHSQPRDRPLPRRHSCGINPNCFEPRETCWSYGEQFMNSQPRKGKLRDYTKHNKEK